MKTYMYHLLRPLLGRTKQFILIALLNIFVMESASQANPCPRCAAGRDDCMTPRKMRSVSTGKWRDDITPKRGWRPVYVQDLGKDNKQKCQMCERMLIRYAHVMRHAHDGLQLTVGCVCAGHMEGYSLRESTISQNVSRAKKRKGRMVRRKRMRDRFPTSKEWKKLSSTGKPYLDDERGRIIIHHETDSEGGLRYFPTLDGRRRELYQNYSTIEEAKAVAFDWINPRRIRLFATSDSPSGS